MKLKYVSGILMAAIVFVSPGAMAWETLSAAEDLSDWQVLSGEWEIEDGVIRGMAAPAEVAWLRYEGQEYGDMEITVEFRTPEPINGGVQFYGHWLPRLPLAEGESPGDAPKVMYGYQADIETRQRLSSGRLICENARGAIADTAEDAAKTLKQRGWNEMRIVAQDGVIEVYLGDELANRTKDEQYRRGALALQVYALGSEAPENVIEYRNFRVRELPREDGWQEIFDGESLDGWETYGTEEWYAEDGILYGASGPDNSEGYIATTENYKDFLFEGEMKMMGGGNYGFFFHANIALREEDDYPVISGMQVEIDPSYPTSTGWLYESYKRAWLVEPNHASLPCLAMRPQDWNHLMVRVEDNHYTTWLNGVRVMDFVDEEKSTTDGSLAFQIHAGGADGVQKRNLMVKRL